MLLTCAVHFGNAHLQLLQYQRAVSPMCVLDEMSKIRVVPDSRQGCCFLWRCRFLTLTLNVAVTVTLTLILALMG